MTHKRTIIPNNNNDMQAACLVHNMDTDPASFEMWFTPIIAWVVEFAELEDMADDVMQEQCVTVVTIDPKAQPVTVVINRATGDWWMLGDGSGKGEETLLRILTERTEKISA